ncbi:hypothetical protein AAF712_012207 [Marasmius tenuissimus]|uniref:CxC2-like cysteine cluster KDZ transposase-associated domain-containing protein n=1 Tax=Marasmius tenuissimus TaxID=585030 RepID=A0ABR2ZJ13_9AGAR
MPKSKEKKKRGYTTLEGFDTQKHHVTTSSRSRIREAKVNITVEKDFEEFDHVDEVVAEADQVGNENWNESFGMVGMPGGWDSETTIAENSEIEPGYIKVKTTSKKRRYEDSVCYHSAPVQFRLTEDTQDAPLLTWAEKHREQYMDSVLATEGRGRIFFGQECCSECKGTKAIFRCMDCFGLRMLCKTCIVHHHRDEPLHFIQEWNGTHFKQVALRDLGLAIQVGHSRGERCPFPDSVSQFVVLAWNGIHTVHINFCGCQQSTGIDRHLQLLELGWWPSSYKEPRSAATFQLLRHFHITNLQGQTPPTDFYQSLAQMTDGTGLEKLPDREAQFMIMLRQWRHIKMCKRCGRGHDPSGIAGTKHGEAAVPCRACPHPDKNMPEDWEMAPADEQYLHALFLAEDANFKQKARARPNDSRDPALGPGFGCFVPNDIYLEELGKRTSQEEISHCVGFKAISTANSKKSKGLRATGIGSIGERYSNMDFIALFNLIGCLLTLVYFSYDIACQWIVNFWTRMAEYPEYMHIPNRMKLIFKIPKFHLVAHGIKCLAKFSFNYTFGAAKTDGEGVERVWAWLNACARSLSMMTAGGRWDTMDDFCNFWNWRRTIGLEKTLHNKIIKAIPEAVVNARAFSAFTEALKEDHSADLSKWLEQVVRWEPGANVRCPYDVPGERAGGRGAPEGDSRRNPSNSTSTLSELIIEALEIEEIQRSLSTSISEKKKLTPLQEQGIQTRRTNLLQRIRRFRDALLVHIPSLRRLIEAEPLVECSRPESMKLFVPSTISTPSRSTIFPLAVITLEDRLRFAQAYESLSDLRTQLRTRSVAYRNTSRLEPSQGMYTKMRALQDKIEVKIKALTLTYRAARAALVETRGEGDWMRHLKVLRDEDIRGISERVLKESEKEDYRRAQEQAGVSADAIDDILINGNTPTQPFNPVLSLGQREGCSFEEIIDSLRAEWCKARANAMRPAEELRLVEEEMSRAIRFCHHLANWWEARIGKRKGLSPWLEEGLSAYANEHARIERERARHWASVWFTIRERAKIILRYVSNPLNNTSMPAMPELEVEFEIENEEEFANGEFDD